MSLLLSEGHRFARHYPLGHLWSETEFARRRNNQRISTEAVVMQAVIASALAGGKHLENVLRRLESGSS